MIGIIIWVGVFVGFLIHNIKIERKSEAKEKRGKDRGNYIVLTVITFLVSVVVWIAVEAIMIIPAQRLMTEKKQSSELIKSEKIIALRDTSAIDGQFFLGCGSVGEDEWYVYYTDTEFGYKKNKVSADNSNRPVYLKYINEEESPRIDEYGWVTRKTLKRKSFFLSLFAYIDVAEYDVGDEISATYSTSSFTGGNANDRRYEIYIPEGSIKEYYEIDLE